LFQLGVVNVFLIYCFNETLERDQSSMINNMMKREATTSHKHSLPRYIKENLRWHMGQVLSLFDDFTLPNQWFDHRSLIVSRSVAMALGVEGIKQRASEFEKMNRFICAARVLYLSKHITSHFSSHEEYVAMLRQSCSLLEKAKDPSFFMLEIDVILSSLGMETDTKMFIELHDRLRLIIYNFKQNPDGYKVNGDTLFQVAWAETVVLSNVNKWHMKLGDPLTPVQWLYNHTQSIIAARHAASIAPNKTMFHYLNGLFAPSTLSFEICLYSDANRDQFIEYVGSEDTLRRALEAYSYDGWHNTLKTSG